MPPPPYCSGIVAPSRPRPAISGISSFGKRPWSKQSPMIGSTRSSTKRPTESCTMRSSSLSSARTSYRSSGFRRTAMEAPEGARKSRYCSATHAPAQAGRPRRVRMERACPGPSLRRTSAPRKSMFKGVLLGFMAFAAFAASDAFVKSLRGSLPAYEAVFFGAALGLTALPFIKGSDERWRDVVRAQRPGLWLVRALASAMGSIAAVMAFTALPMAEAFALIFLLPIFVTILSVLVLKEAVGWRRWSAVVAGFVGVLVVLRPGFRVLGIGHLAAIVCGLSGAVSMIALRMAGPHEKRVTLYGAGMVGSMLVAGLL